MSHHTPKLSICLPVFNGQRYLALAIESILGQSFADFELVIVDNASTDQTESIARDYARRDRRVRFHRNERNLGAAPNFNRAYHLSSGPLVRWASYDDLWTRDAMKLCIERLERDPSIICCHGRTQVIDEQGAPVPTYDRAAGPPPGPGHIPEDRLYDPADRVLDADRPSQRLSELLLRTHWCYEIFGVIRRSVLERTTLHGSFYGSDKVLLAELLLAGKIVNVPETVFLRRDHQGNSTSLRTHSERADWMDTSLGGRIRRPHLRLLKGYAGAIRRAQIPAREKLACWRVLLAWMLQFRKLGQVVYESDSESPVPQAVSAHS
ncbi:MAG: glycosyltransferase [Phycisphaerae bacterium]|nr:glycosyltransferase [Phycisphaerae bacterium]MDW8262283.1 glycosyltransferase [Phycisphaerales bacterium]